MMQAKGKIKFGNADGVEVVCTLPVPHLHQPQGAGGGAERKDLPFNAECALVADTRAALEAALKKWQDERGQTHSLNITTHKTGVETLNVKLLAVGRLDQRKATAPTGATNAEGKPKVKTTWRMAVGLKFVVVAATLRQSSGQATREDTQ